ncbi:MAG TPA: rhodanese-like domain-containing protein [Gammaproteobacteria bacterium]|nr:rhodanese-like domain-containing protein [Gammaproteobacteria bacterium]
MAKIYSIESNQLKEWMESGKVELIDVRNLDEYDAMNIAGSKLKPVNEVSLDDIECTDDPEVRLVIHCRSGKRSMMACQQLIAEGLSKDVWNLEGGILAWSTTGFPVQGKDLAS